MPLDHPYVMDCWTSVAGPTAVLFLRRAAQAFLDATPPVTPVVDTAELAASLGISPGRGRAGVLGHTIRRLGRFGLAEWRPGPEVAVTVLVPVLSGRQLARAPEWVRHRHQLHLAGSGLTASTRGAERAEGGAGDAPTQSRPTIRPEADTRALGL